jgi:hypothetical protein
MVTMLTVQTKLVIPSTGGRKSRLANADTTLGKCVRYGAVPVLISWCVILGCGAVYAPQFFSDSHWSFDPPPGSRSQLANSAFAELFPQKTLE